jgi:hypothetical protein
VEQLSGTEHVPAFLRGPVYEYAGLVRELAGSNAEALVLYGAVVAGSFEPDRHVARSVLVLGQIDLRMLKRLAEHGGKLGKLLISAPLIMTPAYIRDSLDTFPLEMLEIQQQHVTLFGREYFSDLPFTRDHIRLQCERELKVVLIGLRQGLLAAAGREKLLGDLETGWAENLMRTVRGLLWLMGDTEPKPGAAVLDAVEMVADRRLDGVRAALDPSGDHGWRDFEHLYEDVAALGAKVDAL